MPLTTVLNTLTSKQRAWLKRVKNLGHDAGGEMVSALDALLSGSGISLGRTLVKTANYTALGDADKGHIIFMNKAGSEAVITLPTPAEGHDWTFVQMQAQSMKVSSAAGDNIVGKGDADLDSVAINGIGQAMRVISFSLDDGVTFKHLVIPYTWFAATALALLVDNGGGAAADGTIAAITLTEPADLAAQTVINNALANAVKELSTKINAVITALGLHTIVD